MSYHIRRANLNDLDTLVSFTIAEADEAEGSKKSPGTIRKGVGAALEDDSLARYWVLEKDNSGVIASVSVVKEWSDWHAGYYWWIQSIYIRPQFRGRGLVEKLISTVKEKAAAEGALEIRLYVHQSNIRAIKAYQKTGFSTLDYRIMKLDI